MVIAAHFPARPIRARSGPWTADNRTMAVRSNGGLRRAESAPNRAEPWTNTAMPSFVAHEQAQLGSVASWRCRITTPTWTQGPIRRIAEAAWRGRSAVIDWMKHERLRTVGPRRWIRVKGSGIGGWGAAGCGRKSEEHDWQLNGQTGVG